ncbi:peptidyl-tRNA hydrolase Pth1 [Schizosaccharomyces cryophilus OY26]|uniref:peptidyl-tRNA hydrolase n=1 Tax=Schizosaccharomyces cryophilus (strain OY26 / ATCC MYA-4695 / CBS 11777 / NBRC 106824 / NRRL Y48691) TaxID=653667 RepID=S9XJR0_SCHCR|nr:peptidyl-tRNA hydrolase Pth1 [Schizosaccharomyces cryophilus OY26]EPY53941.1 peptidyl-tRNA hydrolase Pth1 [Schizosaccharomyces cryophilus OY26]
MYAERMNFPKGWPSTKDNITLYPSNNYMNDSGKLLRKVQSQYLNSLSSMEKARAACIVVHDELELDLGKLRYRIGGSHKGHNGVRSCQAILGKEGFHRISVGIGRCESRSSNEVASFVLGKFKPNEMKVIETSVFEEFSSLLNHIRFGMITKKVSSNTQGNSKQC